MTKKIFISIMFIRTRERSICIVMSNNKKILTILALFISSTIYSENFVISKAEKKEKIEKLKKD